MPASEAVRRTQEALLAQGYVLPRWGADGVLGDETRRALAMWAHDHSRITPLEVDARVAEDVESTLHLVVELPPLVLDCRDLHAHKAVRGVNGWQRIDTVCLHQMACDDGNDAPSSWKRWKNLDIHFVVMRQGQAAWLNDCNALVWHGHGWNGRSVGFEVEGWYAGVDGDQRTLWVPHEKPVGWSEAAWAAYVARRSVPMHLTDSMVEASLQAIRLAVQQVAAHGGKVLYVGAHRQSFGEKDSDPGEEIWRRVALPAMREHGLATAPTLRGGKPIPTAWDPGQAGVRY